MKLHKTLYLKFLLAYLIFGVLSFIAVSAVAGKLTENLLIRRQSERLYRIASEAASDIGGKLRGGEDARNEALSEIRKLDSYMDARLRIIDTSGRQIMYSGDASDEPAPDLSGFDPTSSGTYYMTGKFYDAFDEDMLNVFYPITLRYSVVGYCVIHYPLSHIYRERDLILNIVYIASLMVFLLSLSVLILFSHAVYLPLRKTIKAAEEYAQGHMDYPLEINRRDEMGYLSGTLSFMAGQISRTEDDQKKFIANVSHDFRSPLTSVRGYLTAMLDGTIPEEMHEKYLTIVLNETERLTKLTNGLLELNSLNDKGMVLSMSDFDINAVIKQTCETFQVQCEKKKISFEVILSGEELFVHADKDKIQQVLVNLIDNAIKFSYNNSMIRIETTEKNDLAFVSVKDSGIGIPKDSVKHVFDRFYKTDLSRGKDKKGTGLGLSITKEIIKAHNENINVISTEGVGSEFIFTLHISTEEEEL